MAQPTPTVLGPVNGYIPAGTTRYVFVPTIANVSAPTLAEISAGTDLTNVIAGDSSGVTGFAGTSATVPFPNAGNRWQSQVTGLITAAASSFKINRDKTGADVALALFSDGSDGTTQPTAGFFVIMYTGNVASGKMRVFPIQVTSVEDSQDVTTAAVTTVNVAITEPPSQRIPIPTA